METKIDFDYPQFIKMDSDKKKLLEQITNNQVSAFYKSEIGELYFLSASLGFKNKIRLKSNKREDIRLYNTLRDNFKLFIRVVSLSESNFDYEILKDGSTTLKIVEEYANGGAQILYEKIFNGGTNFSVEDELWNEVKVTLSDES